MSNANFNVLIKFVILNCFLIIPVWTTDVIGCGGFLKSDVSFDYSKVSIKLFTVSGNLKYISDCAPNNGYYFIPIYDKGEFVLKIDAPEGWKFEPNKVDVVIDGVNDPCSKNHDINFNFKGFTVIGKIISKGLETGPKDIKVTLKDKKQNKSLKVFQTNEKGYYKFEEVFPGFYEIVAEKKFNFETSNIINLTIIDDNVDLNADSNKILVVSGYHIIGQVTNEGEPIKGVIFALYSKKKVPISSKNCNIQPLPKRNNEPMGYLCNTLSKSDGKFQFFDIPPGEYELLAYYRGSNIEFDVKPSLVSLKVENDVVNIEKIFKVEGFSVAGKVRTSANGRGIEGAQILVTNEKNDLEKIINTSNDGSFHLENMKIGTYNLNVTVPHILFEIETVKILPAAPTIPEIIASAFEVCCSLIFVSENKDIKLNILNLKENLSQTLETKDGKVCSFFKPGKYHIRPESDLIFKPRFLEVEIRNEPILDLSISQCSFSIEGKLVLKEPIKDDIVVTLEKNGIIEQEIKQFNKNEFRFKSLLPGNYHVNVLKGDGIWCWKNDRIDVKLSDEDIKGVDLIQMGYYLTLFSSHETSLQIKYPSGKENVLHIKSNTIEKICLNEKGEYKIIPTSCHKFENEQYFFNTDSPKMVQMNAIKHEVSALLTTAGLNTTEDLVVKGIIKSGDKMEEITSSLMLLNSSKSIKGDIYIFQVSLFGKPGDEITLRPHSSSLLFKPIEFKMLMENNCAHKAVNFRGSTGLFLKGHIIPALSDVEVELYKKDTNELILTIKSDGNGEYKAGPLDVDDIEKEIFVKAEKSGYLIANGSKFGEFIAKKLSSVIVIIEDKKPLKDVLISISGGPNNFRRNVISQENGRLEFLGLNAGQYFVRAVLKEFEFEPSSQILNLKQGETVELKIWGHRVAYSCFGMTTSLSGEPEPNIMVEAIGLGGVNSKGINCSLFLEEGISDSNGHFRIRDLKPDCEFEIRFKSNIQYSLPEKRKIMINNSDVVGVKLILMNRLNTMEITGNIISDPNEWGSISIKMYPENNPDDVTIVPVTSGFFYIPFAVPIDGKWYTIQVGENDHGVTFKANTSFKHINLEYSKLEKAPIVTIESHGSSFKWMFVLSIVALAWNWSKIISLCKDLSNLLKTEVKKKKKKN